MTVQILGSDKAIRLNNFSTLGLVQNFNWAPNFNAQDIFELGTTTRLDTLMELETQGSFELVSSGNLAGLLARMHVTYSGSDFNGFEYSTSVVSGSVLGVNNYMFTQDDLANMKFDVVEHAKPDQINFSRSTYLGCCYPTSISGRVDATGLASDSINFMGLYVGGFPSPYHDVVSVPAYRASATTLTTDAAYNSTDYRIAYVNIDGIPVRKNTADTVQITSFATNTITVSGLSVPVGAVATAVLYKITPNTDWSLVHAPETIGSLGQASEVYGIRGYQASVFIAPDGSVDGNGMLIPNADSQWLRVQNIDFNIDFRMEALRQVAYNLQGTTVYHRAVTFPLNMTVNATVTETDWEDWKALLLKTFPGGGAENDLWENTYDFSPSSLKKDFAVVIRYYTKDGTLIQQLDFPDLRPDGFGSRVNVGGRSEITWTFRGSEMRLKGEDIA